MKARDKVRLLDERERLLTIEAGVQRATLAAAFAKWEEKKLLAIGSTLATWAWRLMAIPNIRWMVAAAVLAKLRNRRNH